MNNLSAPTRQAIYGLAILGLFIVMIPYKERLQARKDRHDLGEATIGQVDTGSFMLKLALWAGRAASPPTSCGPAPSTCRRSTSGTAWRRRWT
jgi:hypothetical protein